MDSRIREIEQWVAEAKAGLDDCGRDAYLNKLYLLDAEIRAVIKENGIPAAVSPRQQPMRVRRMVMAALPFAGAIGVLVLLAATVFLAVQLKTPGLTPPVLRADIPSAANATPVPGPVETRLIGYIPASITGEEILGSGWTPAVEAEPVPDPAEVPVIESAPALMHRGPSVVLAAVTPPTAERRLPVLTQANLATNLVAVAPPGSNSPVARQPAIDKPNTMAGSTSFLNGELERTVAANFSYFPESGDEPEIEINQTKEQLGNQILGRHTNEETVDNVDSSEAAEESSVDNSEPELDSTALAKLLEEKISQRNKR